MDLFGRWCINRQPAQFVLKGPSWETSGWRGAGSGLGGALGSESLPSRKCKTLFCLIHVRGLFCIKEVLKWYLVLIFPIGMLLKSLSSKSPNVQSQ